MCGITGWVDYQRDLTKEIKTIENMAQTLTRRGPDASNIWSSTHCLFGHKRLVVVDPSGGKQPMTRAKQEKEYTICYNGELYNTEDIRSELLKRGYRFQSHSDTEVLLNSYIEWQENCVDHLNGIFAFSIWDHQHNKLFAARDRLGVKPFFYKEQGGSFLFGSEIKAILKHPDVKTELDREGLQEVFGLAPSRTPGHGVFRGMKELRPAHALTLSRENGLKIWRYWNVKSVEHRESLDDTASHVRSLFTDAVERQLVSDVPVCTFLSGGVDSSAISAIAAKYYKEKRNEKLHTFSIDYVDNDKYFKKSDFQPNADGPYIKKMTDSLGTIHHSLIINTEQLVDHLKESVHVRDLPGMADVDSSLLWFCKEIKKHATVGLSGECADEIFGGYPWFHKQELLYYDGFPWMRSLKAREELLKPEWQRTLKLEQYVSRRYQETVNETPTLDGEEKVEARRRELFYLNLLWFMTTLLDRKDRMSMGASLEVRVPFSDHRIVEYVWNIPWKMKMIDDREKGILRRALQGILPNEVLYRKKSPYPKTHNPHYTKAVRTWLLDILKQNNSPLLEFFDRNKLEQIALTDGQSFKVPWFGQLMTGPQLIAFLAQLHFWLVEYNINIIDQPV